ncbi:beta strand repeat-containing protein, partial [bacterium]
SNLTNVLGTDSTKVAKTGDLMSGDLNINASLAASGNITAATGTVTADDLLLTGNATAAFFIGDGSNLTNVTGTDATKVAKTGDLMSGDLNINASLAASGNITAATGTVTADDLLLTGNATAGFFFGDGSNLTNVNDTTKVLKSGDTMTGNLTMGGFNILDAGNLQTNSLEDNDDAWLTVFDNLAVNDSLLVGKMTLTQNDVHVGNTADLLVSGNITAATGTVTADDLLLTGNATAGFFFGDGSNLSNVSAMDSTKVAKTGDLMSGDLNINAGLAVSGNISAATGTVTADDLLLTGNATAGFFIGDGSNLTNVTGTDATKVAKTGDLMSGDLNINASLAASGDISAATGTVTADILILSGNATGTNFLLSGNSTAAYFFGDGSNLTNVGGTDATRVAKTGDLMSGDLNINASLAASGNITAATGTVTADILILSGNATGTNFILSGNSTAAYFFGDGSNLTNVGGTDATRVAKTGDLMSGDLNINASLAASGNITAATGTVTADILILSGNATGTNFILSGNSTAAYFFGDGSNLTNVDDNTKVLKAGDTMTGDLTMGGNNILDAGTVQTNTIEDNDDGWLMLNDSVGVNNNLVVSGTTNQLGGVVITQGGATATLSLYNTAGGDNLLYGDQTGGGDLIYLEVGGNRTFYVDNSGNIFASGAMVLDSYASATTYYGDGSNLTGINAADKVAKTGDVMTGDLNVNASVYISGDLEAATGALQFQSASGSTMILSGDATGTNFYLSGNSTAAYFFGDGSYLTNVTALDA